MRTYVASKTKINWKRSTGKVVNRLNWVPTILHTSFVSVNFGKNMPESCATFGCTNRRSSTSLQFYLIPSAKRYPEQRIKWVTAMRREKWVAQVIKNYIYLSGAKLNDPLHIVYVSNVFTFFNISAKQTQASLKRYERAQKRLRRPNITTTSKIFTAP